MAMVKRCGSSLTISRQPTLSVGWRHEVGMCDHRERSHYTWVGVVAREARGTIRSSEALTAHDAERWITACSLPFSRRNNEDSTGRRISI